MCTRACRTVSDAEVGTEMDRENVLDETDIDGVVYYVCCDDLLMRPELFAGVGILIGMCLQGQQSLK